MARCEDAVHRLRSGCIPPGPEPMPIPLPDAPGSTRDRGLEPDIVFSLAAAFGEMLVKHAGKQNVGLPSAA